MAASADGARDGLCPVCRAGFTSMDADPWSALTCGHLLHDLCIQGMMDADPGVPRESLPCPECRRSGESFGAQIAALSNQLPPLQVDNYSMFEIA